MKLCRFELKSDPGVDRSGMVFGGKIYETNGAEAVGVHEAIDVRPLTPVQHPGSVRLFRSDLQSDTDDSAGLSFFYSNPACLVGPSTIVNHPDFTTELGFEPYLGAIVVQDGYALDDAEGDDIILGLTVVNVFVARDVERRLGRPGGRSHDIAIAFGPVLTTPEELEDAIIGSENGRTHKLSVVVRVNGEERGQGDTEDLPISMAQAIAFASESCTLRTGDLIAVGPLIDLDNDLTLERGDDVQVAVERLGTLSTTIGDSI